jgi:hypothetical protein
MSKKSENPRFRLRLIGNPADDWLGDGFIANSRDEFLFGLTGDKPQGTYSSLPVLQVAIGRRQG